MKVNELLYKKLIQKISENQYKCRSCNEIFSKVGISSHHSYNHEKEGQKKKEELRQIALTNNNKPEMKKKISDRTLKAFKRPEVKKNFLEVMHSDSYRENSRKAQIKLWQNGDYRKSQSQKIKETRTEEFNQKMSETIKIVHNDPNGTVQSKEFSQKMSEMVTEIWKDPIQRKQRVDSMLKSWDNPQRRKNQSRMATNMWTDPDHIEKVLDGKVQFLKKTGQNPSLGKFGITSCGTVYESTFEKIIFEFLEEYDIKFQAHVNLPHSSKICDLVIDNVWIELDGLNRDQFRADSMYSWNGKIEIYKKLKKEGKIFDYLIFKNAGEFIQWLLASENI